MATYYSQNSGNWSTLTNWNSARDGSGGSPASIAAMDDQTFVIQPGHTVIFDVEDALECDGSISGWTTGISGITIEGVSSGTPGELTLSSTANSTNRIYGLRLKNGMYIQGTNATVYGKLTAGSQETPIPSNSKTIIEMQDPSVTSPYTIIGGTYLVIALYGTGPIEPVYELTSAAASSDTQLQVRGLRDHTNPNVETEWHPGDTVVICNINKGLSKTVSILDSNTPIGDGVLNLSSPIGIAMLQGALVCLLNRNITIRISGSPVSFAYCLYNANNAILDSVFVNGYATNALASIGYSYTFNIQGTSIIYSNRYDFFGCGSYFNICDRSVCIGSIIISNSSDWTISDEAVCCGSSYLISTTSSGVAARRFEISGNVIIAGNTYGIGGTLWAFGIVKGNVKVYGCTYGIANIYATDILNVKIYQCSYGIYRCSNLNVYSCELGVDSKNTIDIYEGGCKLYNTKLNSSTPVSGYAIKYRDDWMYKSVISLNHNNIKSKYPTSWMPGGTVIPNSSYSPMPDGHMEICQMNFSQPSGMAAGTYNHNWVDIPILIQSGDIIIIDLWMVKNINNMGIIPQASLLTYSGDPWSISPIDSYTMLDNTNEQTDILVYDNSSSEINKMIFLRVFGGHTSGILYWAYNINKWNAGRMNGWIS